MSIKKTKTIAVLGAGIQGVCIALELADRGFRVDLYEKNSEIMSEASLINEGKIHLGFVYANETNAKTAEMLINGAMHFYELLRRWCNIDNIERYLSTPFLYGIHRNSMIPTDQISDHFNYIERLYKSYSNNVKSKYLGINDTAVFEPLSKKSLEDNFNPEFILSAFQTCERGIDTYWVAEQLKLAIMHTPQINLFKSTQITRVTIHDKNYSEVFYQKDEEQDSSNYHHVFNCLWSNRLMIDKTAGIKPHRPWLHRFKNAIHIELKTPIPVIPSSTMLLGPFGDIVNYHSNRIYLSWYPSCRTGASALLIPPDWNNQMNEEMSEEIKLTTFAALKDIAPSLNHLTEATIKNISIKGGMIFAWGDSDITQINSGLHSRNDIGCQSLGTYHSINTGKYSMAPFIAWKTCANIFN